jgi:PAS domain S-box-containing protein
VLTLIDNEANPWVLGFGFLTTIGTLIVNGWLAKQQRENLVARQSEEARTIAARLADTTRENLDKTTARIMKNHDEHTERFETLVTHTNGLVDKLVAAVKSQAIKEGIADGLTQAQPEVAAHQVEQAYLSAVVASAVDGVILINSKGTVLIFNPACEKLFGYTAAEVIGQNVKMLMPPPYYEAHDGYLERYARTREPHIIGMGREVTGRRKNGSQFLFDLSVGEAAQAGMETTYVGIIHDLTQRKLDEAAERSRNSDSANDS